MKKTIIAIAVLLAANTATFAQVHKQSHTKNTAAKAKYTCSMHPEVVKNKPGNCPKCGMALVKMKPGKKGKAKGEMKDMKM